MSDNDLYSMRQKLFALQNELLKTADTEKKQEAVPAAPLKQEQASDDVREMLKEIKAQQVRMTVLLEEILRRLK